MNILFLAPSYLNLYKEILDELVRQGHFVQHVEDKALVPFENSSTPSIWQKLYLRIKKPYEKFWKRILYDAQYLDKNFDVLFCIQGLSFYPPVLEELRKRNPNVRSVLYLWDSNRYYNYMTYANYFDKVYSFDWQDSKDFPNVKYLPFFWVPIPDSEKIQVKYKLSLVGVDHDGRFEIVKKIIPQLESKSYPYYIKLFIEKPNLPSNPLRRIRYYNQWKRDMKVYIEKIKSPISIDHGIPPKEVERIIAESDCILDTDREIQTGTTPRVIWAMAAGKKIITTNTSIKELPFYDKSQFMLVDRVSPQIDFSFMSNNKVSRGNSSFLEQLRIDNWVRMILANRDFIYT